MGHKGCCCRHQEACVQAQVTLHTSPPGSLSSLPLPGSRDTRTTFPGRHTACLRLLQWHAGLCRHRLALHPYPYLPLAWVSQSSRTSCSFNPVLSERRTDTLRWPTRRGRSKPKAEPRELCKQRREREIFPSSLRSSGLNLHNQLDVPCIYEILEQKMNHPKLRRWTLGAKIYIFFRFLSSCECVCVCFCAWFCLYSFAFTICPGVLSVPYFFFSLWKIFLNNYSLFFILIILFYFILSSFFLFFFLSFYFLSLLFWAVWMKGSWCSSQASRLCLWGGRANFRTLVHKRPPSSK